jgi:hypothetical protein
MDEELLKMARAGFQQQANMIARKIAEIDAQLSGKKRGRPAAVKPMGVVPKRKRKLSAEALARISAAQKKRWAAFYKQKKTA